MLSIEGVVIPDGAGIDDKHVADSAPLIRALVTQRLEMLWRVCEPQINLPTEALEAGRRPDPRYIEAGIRVTDRLARLYRLDHPQPGANEPDGATREEVRELVRAQIQALEARMGGQAAG